MDLDRVGLDALISHDADLGDDRIARLRMRDARREQHTGQQRKQNFAAQAGCG
jgi:hypothetical protein